MSSSRDNQLDRLLEDWANKSAASAEDLDTLQRQVGQRLEANEYRDDIFRSVVPGSVKSQWKVAVVGLASAAVLLIAIGLWREHVRQNGRMDNLSQLALSVNGHDRPYPPHVSIGHQNRLLNEYREVFGPELAWIVEEDGQIDVELIDSSGSVAISPTGRFVAIRLMLWARPVKGNQRQWKQMQSFNLLVRQEELVRTSPTVGKNSLLVIWAYPLDEEMIAIDLHYQSKALANLQIESSNIQPVGESTHILTIEQDGVEYRLYQTANLLDEDDLG